MIESKDLNFSQNNISLINNLTFNPKNIKLILVTGTNVEEKTLLLKLFAGLIQPTSGLLSIPQNWKRAYIPKRSNGFFNDLTGLQNINFFCDLLNIESTARVTKWCQNSTFNTAVKIPFIECSAEMKQLINIFILTLDSPNLILGDDIFASLDPQTTSFMQNILLSEFPDSILILSVQEQFKWNCDTFEISESMWS
jgi:ABC-type multidrug transport system ATPase subunit